MRVCLDCGNEQEYGHYCEKCNATVFEYQHAKYDDDINPDEIQAETEDQTRGGLFNRLSVILPIIMVIVLVPIVIALVVLSDSSENDTNDDSPKAPPSSTSTTDNKRVDNTPDNNYDYFSVDLYGTEQPFEYHLTQHSDWYLDSSCFGAMAICNDGWCSYCEDREETCSYHGGVKRWLK